MHICPNCLMAFMLALPFVGKLIHWAYHRVKGSVCKGHEHYHEDHIHDPLDPG